MNLQEIQYQTELQYSKQHIRRVILNKLIKTKNKTFNKQIKKAYKILDDVMLVEFLILILVNEFSSIQFLVSQLGQYLPKHFKGGVFQRADKTFKLIYNVAEKTDIIELIQSENGVYVKSNFTVSNKVHSYILKTMFLPPMICPPNQLKRNDDSPYLTTEGHVILKDKNQHNHYQNLEAINISSSIPLSLDERILLLKEKPSKKLNKQGKKNFKAQRKASEQVYKYLVDKGNKFYIPKKYDIRGRNYENSYHVGVIKNTFRKSMIQLHNKQIVPID